MSHAELEVSSEPSHLVLIRDFVRHFCRTVDPPAPDEESINGLELAANEAASNIIRHAYRGRGDRRIRIEAVSHPDRITLTFWYEGESFDASRVRPPAFDGSREGGFGVFIIEECVDEARYSQDSSGRNCIYLAKRRVHPRFSSPSACV